jgi:hypothetical protein
MHICIEEYFSMFTALYRSKVIVFQYKYNVYDVLNVYHGFLIPVLEICVNTKLRTYFIS